jgi:hypothetical protein
MSCIVSHMEEGAPTRESNIGMQMLIERVIK